MKDSEARKHTRKIIKYKKAHEGIRCSVEGCHKQNNTYHEITITTFVAMQFNLCRRHFKQFEQEVTLMLSKNLGAMK